MTRILSEGSRYLPNRWLGSSDSQTAPAATATATAAAAAAEADTTGVNTTATADNIKRDVPPPPREEEPSIELWPFEVFLRACSIYFCFQVRVSESVRSPLFTLSREVYCVGGERARLNCTPRVVCALTQLNILVLPRFPFLNLEMLVSDGR